MSSTAHSEPGLCQPIQTTIFSFAWPLSRYAKAPAILAKGKTWSVTPSPIDATTPRARNRAFEQIQRLTHPDASLVLPTLAYDGNGHALAWGLAIATDVVGELQERGFFARSTWRAYIDEVLAQDGPADARLEKFLHRPWSNERFKRLLDTVVETGRRPPTR